MSGLIVWTRSISESMQGFCSAVILELQASTFSSKMDRLLCRSICMLPIKMYMEFR